MNLIFERSLRNALCPVIHRRNRNISESFESKYFKYHTSSMETFNFSTDHLMLINLLHDAFTRARFDSINDGIIPRTIDDPVIYHAQTLFSKDMVEDYFDCFDPKDSSVQPQKTASDLSYQGLLDRYPFILDTRMTPKKMVKVFSQIDHAYFNLVLKLRFLETKTYTFKDQSTHTKVTSRAKIFSTLDKGSTKLFSVNVKDETLDGRGLKDVVFTFDFTTFFGHAVIQGISLLNIDFVPEEIYTAEVSEYAKLFYIFFLVWKQKKEPLRQKEIAERLQLTDRSPHQMDKTTESILTKLKEKGFIKDYHLLGRIKNRRYEIIKE